MKNPLHLLFGLLLISMACTRHNQIHSDEAISAIEEQQQLPDSMIFIQGKSEVKTRQERDMISYYDYATGFQKDDQPKFIDTTKEFLQTKFINALALKYPQRDSVKSGPTAYGINFVVEVFYNNEGKHEAALYLLEYTNDQNGMVEARPKYIGKHARTVKSLQTPGDLYYYLMTIKRENNTGALMECIRKTGYSVSISDGSEENSYSEEGSIQRDSIDFEYLNFEFDLYNVNFTFNLSIDEAFDSEGNGSYGYSGGGFYYTVSAKREGDNIYLEGYNFSGH